MSQRASLSLAFLRCYIRQRVNEALKSKSATIKTNDLLCEGYIHAVNAVLWHPGKQTHILQIHADKPNDYYTRWPRHGLG